MKKKNVHLTFRQMYLSAALIAMIILGTFIGIVAVALLNSNMKEEALDQLKIAAYQVKEFFAYDIKSNGDVSYNEYSDHKYITALSDEQVELAVFKGNTSFLTSVKKDDGSYNENVAADSAIYKTVSGGTDYSSIRAKVNGETYYVYYTPIYDGNGDFWGMAFAGKPANTVNKTLNYSVLQFFAIEIVVAILVTGVLLFVSKIITTKFHGVQNGLIALSDGDLNVEFEREAIMTELEALGNAGGDLSKRLKETVLEIKNSCEKLTENIALVAQGTNINAESVEQINSAITEVADTSQYVAQSASDMSDKTAVLGENITQISDSVNALRASSKEITTANADATKYMAIAMNSSTDSVNAVSDISGKINETNAAVSRIAECVEMIESISSQTNLLSLNASIEAARAGEAGRGFAVVAGEIRSLADSSKESAAEIRDIVSHITLTTAAMVKQSTVVSDIIDNQKTTILDTQNRFTILSKAVDESIAEINRIGSMMGKLNEIKDAIADGTRSLGAVSEELGASTEEVAASCQNVADSCKNAKEQTEAMQKVNETVTDALNFFKV